MGVIVTKNDFSKNESWLDNDWYSCPNCGIDGLDVSYEYCPFCGTAVHFELDNESNK